MTTTAAKDLDYFRELTSDVVAAYVANNAISTSEVPRLISEVYTSLVSLSDEGPGERQEPAVPIAKSKTASHLVCLDCGAKFRTLSRHLETQHGLNPEQYRARWGLPRDYPMVAPSYSAARSAIARGLHQSGAVAGGAPKAKRAKG